MDETLEDLLLDEDGEVEQGVGLISDLQFEDAEDDD